MRKPCCDKDGNNKGAWSKLEDQKLIDYIRTHGEGAWRSLPKGAGNNSTNFSTKTSTYEMIRISNDVILTEIFLIGLHRCGKSCRLRWINYLRPDIKRGNFAQDEEDLIIKLHALLGNRYAIFMDKIFVYFIQLRQIY